MNRGGARQKVFLNKQDYEAFLKLLGDLHDRWGTFREIGHVGESKPSPIVC